jgi:hypothetical protein
MRPAEDANLVTAQGGDLLAWLYGAIRTREEAAHAAAGEGTPDWREDTMLYGVRDTTNRLVARTQESDAASVRHIALNDPHSVLSRCASDRKQLELHAAQAHACPSFDYDEDLDSFSRFYGHETCPVVRHLAEGYGWAESA